MIDKERLNTVMSWRRVFEWLGGRSDRLDTTDDPLLRQCRKAWQDNEWMKE